MSDHTQPKQNPLEKIKRIADLLELEYREHRAHQSPHVAKMFHLAALRIRYAFGHPVAPFTHEESDIYALSGFKQPIDQLLQDALQHDQLHTITRELIELENQFDAHYCDITHNLYNPAEHLNAGEQIVRHDMPHTIARQRYNPSISR